VLQVPPGWSDRYQPAWGRNKKEAEQRPPKRAGASSARRPAVARSNPAGKDVLPLLRRSSAWRNRRSNTVSAKQRHTIGQGNRTAGQPCRAILSRRGKPQRFRVEDCLATTPPATSTSSPSWLPALGLSWHFLLGLLSRFLRDLLLGSFLLTNVRPPNKTCKRGHASSSWADVRPTSHHKNFL